jgi:hypothetical protein
MNTDLKKWVEEAKENGASKRSWAHLKAMYTPIGGNEESLRSDLKLLASNHLLTVRYSRESKLSGGDEDVVTLIN